MSTIDRDKLGEWLSAYVDGEVSEKQKELIERTLREDEGARRLLDELRMTVDAVSSLPRHAAPDSIAEDVQLHVERSELLSEPGRPVSGRVGRRVLVPAVVSAAAVVGLSVGGLWIMLGRDLPGSGRTLDRLALGPEAPEEVASLKRGRGGDFSAVSSEAEPAAGDEEGNRLIATASFEQKLQAGMGLASVRGHAFRNETVRLQVSVRDEAERDAVAERLVAYLSERDAIDLATLPADEPEQAGSFYYQGRPEVNFAATGEKQLLVRASRRDLEGALDMLADATSKADSIALRVGPLSIRGLEQTRTVLYGLAPSPAGAGDVHAAPPDAYEGRPATEKVAGDETEDADPGAGGGLLADMRRIVDYDTEEFTKALVRAGEKEKGKTMASRRTDGAGSDTGATGEPLSRATVPGSVDKPATDDAKEESRLAESTATRWEPDPRTGPSTRGREPEREREFGDGKDTAEGDSLAHAGEKKGRRALRKERLSLVDSRLEAAEEASRRAGLETRASRDLTGYAARSDLPADHAAQYITLVVEVTVGKPAARRARPADKPNGRRSEDTTAE